MDHHIESLCVSGLCLSLETSVPSQVVTFQSDCLFSETDVLVFGISVTFLILIMPLLFYVSSKESVPCTTMALRAGREWEITFLYEMVKSSL